MIAIIRNVIAQEIIDLVLSVYLAFVARRAFACVKVSIVRFASEVTH